MHCCCALTLALAKLSCCSSDTASAAHSDFLFLCAFKYSDSLTHCYCYNDYQYHFSTTSYQRVSIASYANLWYSQRRHLRPSVRPSVCSSVTLWYCIKTKKASIMISSPSESLNILVSRIWLITKFDRGHPERGRLLRLGWVQTGDFGDFSTK